MRWSLMFLPLLLATGAALAESPPKGEPAPDAGAAAAEAEGENGKEAAPADGATAAGPAPAEAPPQSEADAKALSGMSVLGNQEAPKALVIVPWKSSEIGGSVGISTILDDSRQPIDKGVFMRALGYFEVRSITTRHDGTPAEKTDAALPATAAHRR